METNVYGLYISLLRERDAIDARLDKLKEVIVAEMKHDNIGSYDHKDGTKFSIKTVAKWTYSPEVEGLEDMLKQNKENERDTGKATVEETQTLQVRLAK